MARVTGKRYRAAHLEEMRAKGRADAKRRNARPEMQRRAKNLVLNRVYGITIHDYEAMLADQGGLCAICRKPETSKCRGKIRKLAVDHCHGTGAVRGLLCANCNLMVGYAKDDSLVLTSAIAYVEKHNRTAA